MFKAVVRMPHDRNINGNSRDVKSGNQFPLLVFLLTGRLHQEILSQLQNWNVAPGLPQRSASAAAGKRLQRKGKIFFFLRAFAGVFQTFLLQ